MASTSTQQESFSSSSSFQPKYYDVFVSFRGETRKNFTSHLFAALHLRGLSTATESKLERGEKVWSQLLKAIHGSRVSIIVFSGDYAGSRWCLDELVEILECKRSFQQMVVPVFYHVDPSDVRKQSGSFGQALDNLEKRYEEGKWERWRAALTEVADLSGWDLQNLADGHESKFIESIVKDISNKLNLPYLNVVDYSVSLESRVLDVKRLLRPGSNNICIVGIWGVGGIGKTKIAKVVYNQIFHEFEGSCFLANVRETSKQFNGIIHLQEHLLSDILKDKNQNIRVVDRGIEVIKQRAWSRRVFVVLDDVDNSYQLQALGIRRDWLYSGSLIIVTTRDMSPLEQLQVDEVYNPALLNFNESLELFNRHAFKHPIKDYVELSREVVSHAGGLPLALKVLGSSLFQKTMPEWKSTLKKLKIIPHDEIQEKLRISFDSLEDEQKDIFLDIACFFVGVDKNYTVKILDGCGFFSESAIGVLHRRCLIGLIDYRNQLTMHDLIRDMGRDIARKEHPGKPGKCSRVWFHDDVVDILTNDNGTEAVKGIVLDLPSSNAIQVIDAQAFIKMSRLRLLKLHFALLSGSCKLYLSKELRWLCWLGYPLKSIPSNLSLEKVVAIDLRYSSLKQVWKGKKILSQLKFLNLSHSYYLTKTPNFSGCTNLEVLLLNNCKRLVKVHQSIKCLDKLVALGLKNCKNLRELPVEMKYVQILNLSGCSNLGMLQGFQGSASKSWISCISSQAPPISLQSVLIPSIRQLYLDYTNLSCIPEEIGSLMSLELLRLEGNNFCTLPASISQLSRLRILDVSNCTRLRSLPELPVNVRVAYTRNCVSLERISLGSDFQKSPFLIFHDCHKLVENNFASVEKILCQGLSRHGEFTFSLSASEIPDYVDCQGVGSVLSFIVPNKKIQGWTLYLVLDGSSGTLRGQIRGWRVTSLMRYTVKNKTKGLEYSNYLQWCSYPNQSQDLLMIDHVPQQNRKVEMEVGDGVVFSVCTYTAESMVKKLGIKLIYVDNENEYCTSNDQLGMIQYASPSYSIEQEIAHDDEIKAAGGIEGNDLYRGNIGVYGIDLEDKWFLENGSVTSFEGRVRFLPLIRFEFKGGNWIIKIDSKS